MVTWTTGCDKRPILRQFSACGRPWLPHRKASLRTATQQHEVYVRRLHLAQARKKQHFIYTSCASPLRPHSSTFTLLPASSEHIQLTDRCRCVYSVRQLQRNLRKISLTAIASTRRIAETKNTFREVTRCRCRDGSTRKASRCPGGEGTFLSLRGIMKYQYFNCSFLHHWLNQRTCRKANASTQQTVAIFARKHALKILFSGSFGITVQSGLNVNKWVEKALIN